MSLVSRMAQKKASAQELTGNSVKNVAVTPQQQNYLTTCNSFAWKGDKVQCEAAANQTLRIYQQGEPPGGDPDADTTKYLINHPDRLKEIKQSGFDKMEIIVIGGNGPGRSSMTTMAVRSDGTFNVLKICYDGTDGQRHCDQSCTVLSTATCTFSGVTAPLGLACTSGPAGAEWRKVMTESCPRYQLTLALPSMTSISRRTLAISESKLDGRIPGGYGL